MNTLEFRRVSRRFYTLFNRVREFCRVNVVDTIRNERYSACQLFTVDITVPTSLGERLIRFSGETQVSWSLNPDYTSFKKLIYFDGTDESADKLFTVFLFPYTEEIVIEPALVHEHLTPQKCLDAIKEIEDVISEMLMKYNKAKFKEEEAKEEFIDLLIGA